MGVDVVHRRGRMADKHSERIKYETELLKLMALFVLAVGGGTIGLLLGERTTFRMILVFSGLVATVVLAVGVWRQHRTIQNVIPLLREGSL